MDANFIMIYVEALRIFQNSVQQMVNWLVVVIMTTKHIAHLRLLLLRINVNITVLMIMVTVEILFMGKLKVNWNLEERIANV